MMFKLPAVTAREVVQVLKKEGYALDRQSGSHAIYYREKDKRRVTVSIHSGKDIKRKTLRGIIKDMGLEPEEFKKLL